MTTFPVIRTIPQFCKATGWPELEFSQLKYDKVIEILGWYDLTLDFQFRTKKKGSRRGCGCEYCTKAFLHDEVAGMLFVGGIGAIVWLYQVDAREEGAAHDALFASGR